MCHTRRFGFPAVPYRFSVTQSAYQILALRDGDTIWDSGKTKSSSMTHIRYEGSALHSRDIVEWKVRLWDENDTAGEWQSAAFEMGFLTAEDWKAKWIAGDYQPKKNTRYPADCFRRKFNPAKTVSKARLYITACGIYEAALNGMRVGEFYFAPGTTDYRTRLQYKA